MSLDEVLQYAVKPSLHASLFSVVVRFHVNCCVCSAISTVMTDDVKAWQKHKKVAPHEEIITVGHR